MLSYVIRVSKPWYKIARPGHAKGSQPSYPRTYSANKTNNQIMPTLIKFWILETERQHFSSFSVSSFKTEQS